MLESAIDSRDLQKVARIIGSAPFLRAQYEDACAVLRRAKPRRGANVSSGASSSHGSGGKAVVTMAEPSIDASTSGDGGANGPLEENYYINTETQTGGTALLLASASGDVNLTAELLRRGAEIDHETQRGHTALTWACVCGRLSVVEVCAAFLRIVLRFCTLI